MKTDLRLRWICLVALLAPCVARALDPAKSVYQFNIQNWTRHDGLPGNKVNTITQTGDGYIWIGTQNGLVRFDGHEFTVLPIRLPEAKGQDISSVAAGRDGGFWFAVNGGGFGHYDGSVFSAIGDDRWTHADTSAHVLLVARDGAVWTGTDRALGRWQPESPGSSIFDESTTRVVTLHEDAQNRIWVGTQEAGLFCWSNGQLAPFSDAALATHVIKGIASTPSGDVWVGLEYELRCYDSRGEPKPLPPFGHPITALLVDRHGVTWIGTSSGLMRYHDGQFTSLAKSDGLGSDYVTALFEDREGSLWVGTQSGLSQITDLKFPIYSEKEGLHHGGSLTVSPAAAGGIWITTTHGFAHFDGRTFTNHTSPELLPNPYVKLGLEARNGDFYWVDGDKSINVLSGGRVKARIANTNWPEAITEDAESVVVGLGPTLVRVKDGRVVPYEFTGGRQPDFQWFDNLHTARDGAIWAACYNGVVCVKNGGFRQWSTVDGLSGNRVHFVFEDEDGSIWAGLSTGIARIRGNELRNITAANGLFDNRTYAIVPDRHGFFWVNSGRGIYRVSRRVLNDFADGKSSRVECEPFDGEESVKFTDRIDQEYSGCQSTDGRIWFPNPWGVVMIDPADFVRNRVPPPVIIQKIRVNGTDFDRPVVPLLRPGDERVEFFFTALSYISPKRVQLRYRLDGFDPDWVDAAGRRSTQYNLTPGRYTFHVQAANADGIWNTTGDTITVQLPPPFYATYWFYLLCGLTAGAGLLGAYRWKVRHMRGLQQRLREENDALEAKVSRRTSELARSVALLNATIESVTDGIVAVDLTGTVVCHNSKFADIWGFPADLIDSEDIRRLAEHAAAQLRDPTMFRCRTQALITDPQTPTFDVIELKDGRIFERYASPQVVDGRCVGVVVNWRDTTQRRRAEAAIAEASATLDSLMKHTLDFIYFKDLESRFVRYSDALLRYFELSDPDELKGRTDFDFYPEERARTAREDEQTIIRTGEPIVGKLETAVHPDGRVSWVLTTKMPWRDEAGRIIGTFGVSRDVTAIKAVEAELAYERDLLRGLLDTSPDKIYFKDRESRFIRASKAQADSFRVASPDDMIGKTDFDFFTDEHARPAFEDEQEILRTGQPLIGKVEKETWNDGREGWALTCKMPLRNNAGEIIGTVGISKDITELKEAEAKLEQANKQLVITSREAGMAEVATSVLHNVGNVLNSVNVSATLVIGRLRESKAGNLPRIAAMIEEHAGDLAAFFGQDPRGQKLPAYLTLLGEQLVAEQAEIGVELEHLRKNIEHIKDIVAMQQSYAKVCGFTETVPLTEILEDALRINSGALTRHEVKVVRDYVARPVLTIERHKVMQILVNLIRNAKYACDDSGRTDKTLTLRVVEEAEFAKILVIDNGVGVPPENLTRIFAHGFTTRKEGHGFGLHSGSLTAKELGGSLTVHSDGPGHGATFTLSLPLAQQASE